MELSQSSDAWALVDLLSRLISASRFSPNDLKSEPEQTSKQVLACRVADLSCDASGVSTAADSLEVVMIKVFTSVFVIGSLANTLDEMEAALTRKAAGSGADPASESRAHVVELRIKVEATGRAGGR